MQNTNTTKIKALLIIVLSISFWGACKKMESVNENSVSAPAVNDNNSNVSKVPEQWVDSWAASFLSTTVNGAVQSTPSFNNQTYRLNVYTKLGGTQVRVQLTNKFATNTLTVGAAHVALRSVNNTIVTGSDHVLTFGGLPGVTLAAGAEIWSDPVTFTVAQHVTVAVSVYVPGSLYSLNLSRRARFKNFPVAVNGRLSTKA